MKNKNNHSLSQESAGSLHWNQFIILSIRHRAYERGKFIRDQMKMDEIYRIYNSPNTPGDL